MKNSRFILFLFAFVSLVSFASAQQLQESQELDTYGYYSIENPTRAFANISDILLTESSERPRSFGSIGLKNKNAKVFPLSEIFQKGSFISFKTKSIAGISYKFSGNFTELFIKNNESLGVLNYGGIVLKGTLIKLKRNKQIARQSVRFTYFTGT